MFSKPQSRLNEMKRVGIAAHYFGEVAWKSFMTGVAYVGGSHVGDHGLGAAIGYVVLHIPETAAVIRMQTAVDLQIRDEYKSYKETMKIAQIPHLKKIAVVATSYDDTTHKGVITHELVSDRLVILETSQPLEGEEFKKFFKESWNPDWGEPVRIVNPDEAMIKLSLNVSGQEAKKAFSPTFTEILDESAVSRDPREAWIKQLESSVAEVRKERFQEAANAKSIGSKISKTIHAATESITDPVDAARIRIDASIVVPGGQETKLGVYSRGQGALNFLGMTPVKKAVNLLKDERGTAFIPPQEKKYAPLGAKQKAFQTRTVEAFGPNEKSDNFFQCFVHYFWNNKIRVKN